jgi:uncharacterized membrane protein
MAYTYSTGQRAERLAKGLGWFSVGLGVAELAAPGSIARLIGIRRPNGTTGIIRTMGAREIAAGIMVLSNPRAPMGMWSRVAGDGVDLWLLQQALEREDVDTRRWGPAAAAVLGVTIADLVCAQQLSAVPERAPAQSRRFHLERVVTIAKPIEHVYRFWSDLSNLPRVTRSVEAIEQFENGRSHWRVRTPAGVAIEWDAEITEDRENERLAWRTTSGRVSHSGSVTFRPAPGARGTELRVRLDYEPPGGAVGAGMAWLLDGTLERQIQDDLRRCKQYLETGEVMLSEGPGLWRPARPAEDPREIRSYAGVDR